jgi:hypothetical protein
LNANLRRSRVSHDSDPRQIDNFDKGTSDFGISYRTPSGNTFGWLYRYTDASFPHQTLLDGVLFDRSYIERSARFKLNCELTAKTSVQASAGYLHRQYPQGFTGDFSGDVWDASLKWQPTLRTRVEIDGWRELRAYLDAESDHFISRGGGVHFDWAVLDKTAVSLLVTRETQQYLGDALSIFAAFARHDTVRAQQATITYLPVQWLSFELAGRLEERDSNRPQYGYASRSVSLGFSLKR